MKCALSIAAALAITVTVKGHGAVVQPPPRNSVDRNLAPWNGTVPCDAKTKRCPSVETQTGWCPVPNAKGEISGQNGQSCFWFSNGCAVGCDTCDGNSRGPIPNCGYEPDKPCPPQPDPAGNGRNKVGPGVACHGVQKSTAKPTICAREHRTINIDAECGGEDDWYYYSPWRAPGAAPVMDSCGVAGGHPPPEGRYGGIYVNTTNAKLGDFGTKVLPKFPTGVTWKAGYDYEVSWSIEANHAGGYLYRLAPADGPLTEEEFQKLPLPFVGQQGFRWGGGPANGGSEIFFNGTYVEDGTVPVGSKWSLNPVPRYDHGGAQQPKCKETPLERCTGMADGSDAQPNFEIVDRVLIPKGTPPGEYVLGWRWDCEESNQIWQSCSDVTITV